MIEQLISEVLDRINHLWKIGGELKQPSTEDVARVLDKAAGELYDRPIGTRLEIGGIIIDKQANGHTVYVYCGDYK